jgi:hypothetical protein
MKTMSSRNNFDGHNAGRELLPFSHKRKKRNKNGTGVN